jgi:hypothetical protein
MSAGRDLWNEVQALHKNHDLAGYALVVGPRRRPHRPNRSLRGA